MIYFIGAIKECINFTGRTRRKAFWFYVLFYFVIGITLAISDIILDTTILSISYGILMLIPTLSICTRRLHDTTRKGWWQLIVLIPYIGLIVLIIFLLQDSHDANDYGQSPKSEEADNTEAA